MSRAELRQLTDAAMQGVPLANRFWSLVSISRLSLSFLTRWLALSWSPYNATLVYEELGLPRVCLATDGCSLAEFGLSTQLGSRLLYKPTWACEEVLRFSLVEVIAHIIPVAIVQQKQHTIIQSVY